jgi:hypothetical protein
MSELISLKKKIETPKDALDIESLWLDSKLGDGLTDVRRFSIPVAKPKDFFRVVPDPAYRRTCEIYTHKPEGQVDEQHYIFAGPMVGSFEEAHRCTLVTVIYRDSSLRLWPLKLPTKDGHDNDAWRSTREAAKIAMERWVKLIWERRAYKTRDAQPGYAPDPDYSKLPPFNELVHLAFGESGIIQDRDHPIVRDLLGAGPSNSSQDDDGLS